MVGLGLSLLYQLHLIHLMHLMLLDLWLVCFEWSVSVFLSLIHKSYWRFLWTYSASHQDLLELLIVCIRLSGWWCVIRTAVSSDLLDLNTIILGHDTLIWCTEFELINSGFDFLFVLLDLLWFSIAQFYSAGNPYRRFSFLRLVWFLSRLKFTFLNRGCWSLALILTGISWLVLISIV